MVIYNISSKLKMEKLISTAVKLEDGTRRPSATAISDVPDGAPEHRRCHIFDRETGAG